MKNKIFLLGLTLVFRLANAQASSDQFAVIDLTGSILGEPQASQDAARTSWENACNAWKTETKNLNKNNELLGINCNTPSCSFLDSGKTQCTSTGSYQVKTAGTRVDNPSPPPVQATPAVVVTQPQTEVIYEQAPPPRVGFLWISGFWGWDHFHHHIWHRGYWQRSHRW